MRGIMSTSFGILHLRTTSCRRLSGVMVLRILICWLTQLRTLTVELILQTLGATAPAILRKLIADVEKAILVDNTWGGLVIFTSVMNVIDTFDVEHKDRRIGACRTRFTVLYRTGYL